MTELLYVICLMAAFEVSQRIQRQHEAIIDDDLWHSVQTKLKGNAINRKLGTNTKSRSLLTGLLFDETGNRLTPSHANKKGRRYSYYVSKQLIEGESKIENDAISLGNESENSKTNWRIPAKEIDQAVLNILSDNITNPTKLNTLLPSNKMTIEEHQARTKAATKLVSLLSKSKHIVQRELLSKLVNRVELHQEKIVIEIDLNELQSQTKSNAILNQDSNSYKIEVPYQLKKRGVEARLVIGQTNLREAKPDQQLIMLIAKAHDFMNKLTNGTASSIGELAKQLDMNASNIGTTLRLAFLAPEIIECILNGSQPADLTAEKLRRLPYLPNNWNEQKALLGFDD